MSTIIKTTIVTTATGEISGYGFCVEATTTSDAEEIRAVLSESLDMLRQTIAASFDPPAPAAAQLATDPPPPPPPGQGPDRPEDQPKPAAAPPATPQEAEQRFYARYGAIIGGQDWASVRGYLRQPRRPAPATVEQWYATAKAVQTISQAQQTAAAPAQRQHARH